MVCVIMNGYSVRLSVWCFDQKWWLYAYIGKTTYGLYIYIYIYMTMLMLERPHYGLYIYIYICFERIQFSSLFSGNLFPYLSQVKALDRSPHRDTLFESLSKDLLEDFMA
jgi:hypothetical protein